MTAEDTEDMEKYDLLAGISNAILERRYIMGRNMPPDVIVLSAKGARPGSEFMNVMVQDNRINVYSQRVLRDAIRLAKAYKEAGQPEFTIKKRYKTVFGNAEIQLPAHTSSSKRLRRKQP